MPQTYRRCLRLSGYNQLTYFSEYVGIVVVQLKRMSCMFTWKPTDMAVVIDTTCELKHASFD